MKPTKDSFFFVLHM